MDARGRGLPGHGVILEQVFGVLVKKQGPYHGEGRFLYSHLGYLFKCKTGAGSGFSILFF